MNMKSLRKERIDLIYNIVSERKYLKYSEISNLLNISEATIRRDIKKMESLGLINIILGGIEFKSNDKDTEYSIRIKKNTNQKKIIAKKAAKLLKKNETIFLDSGTTTFELIPYLKNMNITVITNAITHIEALIENKIDFILLGGSIKKITKAVVGSYTLKQIEDFNFDKCFLGTNGIDSKKGFTTPDIEEGLVKKAICKRSKEKIILSDKSKLNIVTNINFSKFNECILITEEDD